MLEHFIKLQTPLKAIGKYPSKQLQIKRFKEAGWHEVQFRSLWSLWRDSKFLSEDERKALDDVELFDEWEELALFASHYFIVVANSSSIYQLSLFDGDDEVIGPSKNQQSITLEDFGSAPDDMVNIIPNSKEIAPRRYAAAMKIQNTVLLHGGVGMQQREITCNIYGVADGRSNKLNGPPMHQGIMCHTITRLDSYEHLMVGGRASPGKTFTECWRYDGKIWQMEHPLVPGRYRHAAVSILSRTRASPTSEEDEKGVLVFGGKTESGGIVQSWDLWLKGHGWKKLKITSKDSNGGPFAFGSCLIRETNDNHGWVFGGIGEDRLIKSGLWRWKLDIDTFSIHMVDCSGSFSNEELRLTSRFGAVVTEIEANAPFAVLAGGIRCDGLPNSSDNVVLISEEMKIQLVDMSSVEQSLSLIGGCILSLSKSYFFIAGGGAVCFSFGSYWSEACILRLHEKTSNDDKNEWHLLNANTPPQAEDMGIRTEVTQRAVAEHMYNDFHDENRVKRLPRTGIETENDFLRIIALGKPVIMCGLDIGSCTTKWSTSYLIDKVGANREVSLLKC